MIIKAKFIMLCLAFSLILPMMAFSGGRSSVNIATDCENCDQTEFNTDADCGTIAGTCNWTFELVCPVEVTCDGPEDLGIFCVGETITPTGDNGWIVFRIGGQAGAKFRVSVNVDENAVDEDGNYDNHVVLSELSWQIFKRYSHYTTWSNYHFASALDMEMGACSSLTYQTVQGNSGDCVSADEDDKNFQLRVRPKSITTSGADGGNFIIRISLGVDFGYQF